jgi:pSer/pThr/pTyr-binding forkhead associated (FHA) protein
MDNLVLEIVEGPGAGRQFHLTAPIEIGRDPSLTLVLEDSLVSRRHARVIPAGSDAIVEDLGSANGTFVNGQEIHAPTSVKPGDQLLLGVSLLEMRSPAQVAERPSAVRAIPPPLARAAQRPDFVPPQLQEGGGQRVAASARSPELEALLDRYTKRKARLAPLAVFALVAIAVTLFVTFVVRKSASGSVPKTGQVLTWVSADHGRSGPGHFVFPANTREIAVI